MEKHIMLAFVSPVSLNYLSAPILYKDIGYTAIQTNESAIVYVEQQNPLSQIFLIVSDYVKNGKVAPGNEFGDVTHLEFLKRRLVKEFPYFSDKFYEIDYSDGASGLDRNILQIAEIADTITNYARNFPDATIKVHADMTGGFRHTSMLMLSIIQLLRYRGIETGEILYSDPAGKIVYRANEIQRMSILITGADEFVKYGSVDALQDYFGNNASAAADYLLDAMKRFSDTIKLCRTATIEKDLNNLGEHIQKFRKNPAKDLKSKLFAKIIDTIESEYGELIKGKANRFEIIRWCMRKGFWQQAMTLCTEWLPEEIVNRGIFKPANQAVIDAAATEGTNFGRDWKQNFIIAYNGNKPLDKKSKFGKDADIDAFVKNLRMLLDLYIYDDIGDAVDKNYCGDIKIFLNEFKKGYADFQNCKAAKIKVNTFKSHYPMFVKGLQAIYDERKKTPDYRKNFYQFLKSIEYGKVIALINNLPADKLLEVFNVDADKIPARDTLIEVADKSMRKWINREKIYLEMFDNEVAKSKLQNRADVMELLRDFYNIRNERNQINHAISTSEREIPALHEMIEKYLRRLEEI